MKFNKTILLLASTVLLACNSNPGVVEPIVEWQESTKESFCESFDAETSAFLDSATTLHKSYDYSFVSEEKIGGKLISKNTTTVKFDVNAPKGMLHVSINVDGMTSEEGENPENFVANTDEYYGYYEGVGFIQASIDNISKEKKYGVLITEEKIDEIAEIEKLTREELISYAVTESLGFVSAYYLVDGNTYDYRRYDEESYWEYEPGSGTFDLKFKTGELGDYFFTCVVSGNVQYGYSSAVETKTVTSDVRGYSLWSLIDETFTKGTYNDGVVTAEYLYTDKAETKPVGTRKFSLPSLKNFTKEAK